jgi:hypothetical protein
MNYRVTICCYHEVYFYKSEAVLFTITFFHNFKPCLLNVRHVLHILYPQFQGKYSSDNLNAYVGRTACRMCEAPTQDPHHLMNCEARNCPRVGASN